MKLRQVVILPLVLALILGSVSFSAPFNPRHALAAPTACATELFFSEYVEGSSNSKALEIVNDTGADVVLTDHYQVQFYSNGSASAGTTIDLDGTVTAGDVFVLADDGADADILAATDQTSTLNFFNGNDAIALVKDGAIIDVIGQIGFDPGSQWGSGDVSTADNTLRRKVTITAGDPDGSDAFDPSVEWDGYAQDTFDGLGSHTVVCGVDNPPQLTTSSPADGATNVDPATTITLNFSENVDLTADAVTLADAEGAQTFSGLPAADLSTVVLTPTAALDTFTTYTVTVYAAEVTDLDGDPNSPADDVVIVFTTGASAVCGDPYTPTYEIQGSGAATPLLDEALAVEGVVVGDFQNNGQEDHGELGGFHIQDPTGDDDPTTSDGVFVYTSSPIDVSPGDWVRVVGTAEEYNTVTEVHGTQVAVCSSGHTITPTEVTLPISSTDYLERYEGMLVTFPQSLVISEYYNFGRYGEIVLTTDRQFQPTALYEPGSPEADALATANTLARITLDDGRTTQNPDPAVHPNGFVFDLDNLFRGGDTVADVTGVIDYARNLYRVQPTKGATHTPTNSRPPAPEDVGGDLRVASFNVLNYFTTLDDGTDSCGPTGGMECRGADTAEEFARQRDKIIAALAQIDADIVGLIEIENGPGDVPTADLVMGLNAMLSAGTYDYIATGAIGTDAIRQALIYKPAAVTPLGDFAVLDSTVDSDFIDTYNRPVLAQTFEDKATGAVFTVAVNHLKSKGSDCTFNDAPDAECNLVRTAAAEAMGEWLATDPTDSGDPDVLIIGDLNAYAKEDPIDALLAAGYTDLVAQFEGEDAYGYVYDGQLGYLDHALANPALRDQVTGTTIWHINADEPSLIDYDMTFKQDAQDELFLPDAYRSSDHDPVIVGLDFAPQTALTKAVSQSEVGIDEPLSYILTLSNTGGLTDTVTLTDTLPADVVFAGLMTQPPGTTFEDGTLTWTGTLAPSETLLFTVVVTNTATTGTITNTATYSATLNAGTASAAYTVTEWKLLLPIVMKGFTP